MKEIKEGDLLIKGDCPYGYRCVTSDCLECAKIKTGERVEK